MQKGFIGDIFTIMFYFAFSVIGLIAMHYMFTAIWNALDPLIGAQVNVTGIQTNWNSMIITAMFMLFFLIVFFFIFSYDLASQVQFAPVQVLIYIFIIPFVVIVASYLQDLMSLFFGLSLFTSTINDFGSLLNFVSDYFVYLFLFFAGLLGYGMYKSKT